MKCVQRNPSESMRWIQLCICPYLEGDGDGAVRLQSEREEETGVDDARGRREAQGAVPLSLAPPSPSTPTAFLWSSLRVRTPPNKVASSTSSRGSCGEERR
jgi:hypothetical protein